MNKEEKDLGSKLAYAALDDVPTPKSDAREIVGLIKSSGRITGYQLSDGAIVSKEEGVSLAKAGEIQGVGLKTADGIVQHDQSCAQQCPAYNIGKPMGPR